MRLAKILTALAVAAIAGLLLAACGGSDSSEVANLGDAAGTTTEEGSENQASEDPEEAILAYTECMREEGIDLPDPDFSGELGEGGGSGFLGGSDIDPNDPDFQAAQEKCQSNLEGVPAAAPDLNGGTPALVVGRGASLRGPQIRVTTRSAPSRNTPPNSANSAPRHASSSRL